MRKTFSTAVTNTALIAAFAIATPAWAQDSVSQGESFLAKVAERPLFQAAQGAAQTSTSGMNAHQFGVGVRLGGVNFGIGGSLRYFFTPQWGLQVEVSRYGIDYGLTDFSSTQFSGAVMFRFEEQTFDAPISLTPYAGGGVSILRSSFDQDFDFGDGDIFDELEDELEDSLTDTSTGVLLFGGVEIFFERVPNLGVSGELTFTSNDDIGIASLGGPAFTVAGHWYFR